MKVYNHGNKYKFASRTCEYCRCGFEFDSADIQVSCVTLGCIEPVCHKFVRCPECKAELEVSSAIHSYLAS